jgi:hypothetical protein
MQHHDNFGEVVGHGKTETEVEVDVGGGEGGTVVQVEAGRARQ